MPELPPINSFCSKEGENRQRNDIRTIGAVAQRQSNARKKMEIVDLLSDGLIEDGGLLYNALAMTGTGCTVRVLRAAYINILSIKR